MAIIFFSFPGRGATEQIERKKKPEFGRFHVPKKNTWVYVSTFMVSQLLASVQI